MIEYSSDDSVSVDIEQLVFERNSIQSKIEELYDKRNELLLIKEEFENRRLAERTRINKMVDLNCGLKAIAGFVEEANDWIEGAQSQKAEESINNILAIIDNRIDELGQKVNIINNELSANYN